MDQPREPTIADVLALATENRDMIFEVKGDVKTLVKGQAIQNGEIAKQKGYWMMVRGALLFAAAASPLMVALNLV